MEAPRVALFAAAVIASVSLLACADSSVHTATYASMAEARQAGAVDKGWVPGDLPGAAYELRAAYDLDDANRRWGLFNFRAADHDALRAKLAPGDVSIAGVVMDIPPRIEWWPVQLRGRLDEERILATGLQAHRSRDGALTFLVNWKQGRGYYWRSARGN
jgi:hypothetical protein